MAETVDTAAKQPATSAATAYKLAPVFLEKEKPVRPPYEPPDQSWIDEWESDDEDEEVEKKDTTDRISGLPVEIIMMIASHLTPGSLLAFSRVSRFFRSLVFTKRAESIWANVRRCEGWQDSQAGGLTEIQLANLFGGDDCTVCQGYAYELADLHLRVRLCYQCRSKLRRKGESASAEYWHLHPRAFEFCLSTRKQQPGWTGELPRGEDSVFFVPDVLKQSAELHKLEAEAVAQNQSPQTISEAYVVSRGHFRQRAKNDATAWSSNAQRLQEEETAAQRRRIELRRQDIDVKMFALGYVAQDIAEAHVVGWWCTECFYHDYGEDFRDWMSEQRWQLKQAAKENQQEVVEDDKPDGEAVSDVGSQAPLEQKLAELEEDSQEEEMAAMLAHWHSNCIPAPWGMLEFTESEDRLTGTEWKKFKGPLLEFAHRERFNRLWRQEETAHAKHQKRKDDLRPVFDRIRMSDRSARRPALPIPFTAFLALPSLKTLGTLASFVLDSAEWPEMKDQIVSEVRTRARLDKIILFDRIVRAHVADNGVLLHADTKAIASSSSPVIDCDPSKGLVPLHVALTDRDMDPLFAQVTSLFRCGICSTKLSYPDIAIHLVDDHDVPNVPAYAHVPSGDFRKAIKSLLDDLGHSSQLELAAFEVFYADCGFDVTTRTGSGEMETSVGETWAQVLSGKSPAELDASRLKLSHSTDRNIVEIKMSTASISDEDA